MKTSFWKYNFPNKEHPEYPEEPYLPYIHPGYELVMCRYCERQYIEARSVEHRYDCGDRQLHGHINKDMTEK